MYQFETPPVYLTPAAAQIRTSNGWWFSLQISRARKPSLNLLLRPIAFPIQAISSRGTCMSFWANNPWECLDTSNIHPGPKCRIENGEVVTGHPTILERPFAKIIASWDQMIVRFSPSDVHCALHKRAPLPPSQLFGQLPRQPVWFSHSRDPFSFGQVDPFVLDCWEPVTKA